MEVNKDEYTKLNIKNVNFFGKGVAKDWSNHVMPEMTGRLDKIVGDALQVSKFTF